MPEFLLPILLIGKKNTQIYRLLMHNLDPTIGFVHPVGNLTEGIQCINYDEPKAFDLVIVDAKVIGKDLELLPQIKEMDAEIPMLIVAHNDRDVNLYHEAGKIGARIVLWETLQRDPSHFTDIVDEVRKKVASSSFGYDHAQRVLANNVAAGYINMETERPGTVAYWLFEEELIKKIVRAKEEDQQTDIKILDVGCGTGRFAKVLMASSETARVWCVDFSGKMLLEARKFLETRGEYGQRFELQRALGQKLPAHYKELFDVVILGFGFPCYSPTSEVLKEAKRVLNNDGLIFASVYNHRALIYENEDFSKEHSNRPITTMIDRERSRMTIPDSEGITARTFTRGQFVRELHRAGFDNVFGYLSFPIIYSTFERSDIASRSLSDVRDKSELCYKQPEFSFALWDVDLQLSRILKEGGFYNVFVASKSTGHHLTEIVNTLNLHPIVDDAKDP